MNETAVYTKEYFIEKLSAIPDENWLTNHYLSDKENSKKGCLLFHLGVKDDYKPTEEATALAEMIKDNLKKLAKNFEICKRMNKNYARMAEDETDDLWILFAINDTAPMYKKTPKQAIIECLELI